MWSRQAGLDICITVANQPRTALDVFLHMAKIWFHVAEERVKEADMAPENDGELYPTRVVTLKPMDDWEEREDEQPDFQIVF